MSKHNLPNKVWYNKLVKNKSFFKRLIGFVYDIYSENKSNTKVNDFVGKKKGIMYSRLNINSFPVEAIFRINNTLGRMMVLYRTEELTSLSGFARNSSMAKILGIVNRKEFDYEEQEKDQDSVTLRWSKEKKLLKVSKLKIKMKKLYAKLFLALAYRYLVEKEVREYQERGDKFEHVIYESETLLFQSYVAFMLYLSNLKHENFNPEIYMRWKLHCYWQLKFIKDQTTILGWMWVYGIQLKQVKPMIEKLDVKNKIINDKLVSWWDYCESENNYTVKEEKRKYVIEEYRGIRNIKLLKRNIEAALGCKVDLAFLNKNA